MRKTIIRVIGAILCFAMLTTGIFTVAAAGKFPDVTEKNWFYDYVTYMAEKKVIIGKDEVDGKLYFRPNDYVKRSEFIKMMVETFGLTDEKSISFSDVSANNWFYSYYKKAAAQGFLTEVFTGNAMRPTEDLTREEAAALLMAYLAYPEDQKASTAKFVDYYEISSGFRNYVLQAAAVGIIDGIEEDDDFYFKPGDTLTRAQAAKILSVAAGTIANDDVSDELEFDESDNLIVIDACTISDLKIEGNVIITEGASGKITFIDCEIEGFVDNRSTADVTFSGGSVEKLNLNAASADVTLKNKAEIKELNANKSGATIAFYANSEVDTLNVVALATGVKVSGSGEIGTANVKASSFSCEFEPEELKLDSGISAVIENVTYKDGLKGEISIVWSGDSEFIAYETYVTGKINYYYTSSATKPSKTNFTSLYNSAVEKDSLTAKAGDAGLEVISGGAISVEDYPYVVVALVDGSNVVSEPAIINREGSKYGFTVKPEMSISSSNDQIKFTPVVAGTLYYYYTNDGIAPSTYSEALLAYKATPSTAKGTKDCTKTAVTMTTKAVTAVEEFSHCVVFYVSENTQFLPMILQRPYLTNGLSTDPYIVISDKADGKDTLVIKAPTGGTVKVLYTNSTLNYTASSFETAYNAANKTPAEGELKLAYSGTVTANKEASIALAKSADVTAAGYQYAVIKLGSNAPIRVARINDIDGFAGTTLPTVLKTTDKDVIVFTPTSFAAYGNTVKYMYVSSSKGYTSETFEATYKTVADNAKKEIPVSSGDMVELKSDKQSANISEQYVAFMFIGSNGAHQPVVVQRGSVGTGLVGTPTASYDVDKAQATLTFNAKVPFDLEYFVIDKNTYSTDTLAHMFDTGRFSDNTDINMSKMFKDNVKQGENKINMTGILPSDKYIAIRAKDINVKYTPVIISLSIVDDGITGGDEPNVTLDSVDGAVKITITAASSAVGKTFEYYYTTTKPETVADYNKIFNANGVSGKFHVNSNSASHTFEAGRWIDMVDYVYLAYRVVDNAGNSLTPGYVTIPVKYRANANIIHDGSAQGKILVTPFDDAKYTVFWFYSTTQLTLTNDNYASSYSSTANRYNRNYKDVESKAQQTIITDFVQPADGKTTYKYVYVCLKDATGKYYQPVELKVPGTNS